MASIEHRIENLEAAANPNHYGIKIEFVWIMCSPYDREPTPEEEARLEKQAIQKDPGQLLYVIDWRGSNKENDHA